MTPTQRPEAPGRMLGYSGLALALAGSVGILWLSEAVTGIGAVPIPAVIGLVAPVCLAAVLMVIPTTRDNSLTWLLSGAWTGLLAALTIFSVGIVFLIATLFLLAAFLRANW